jgi:hypothetical protein
MGEKDRFGFVPKNQILEHGIPSKQARPLGLLTRKRGGETIHVPEGGEPALRRLRQGKRTEDAAAVDPAERGEERDGGLVLAVGFCPYFFFFSYLFYLPTPRSPNIRSRRV